MQQLSSTGLPDVLNQTAPRLADELERDVPSEWSHSLSPENIPFAPKRIRKNLHSYPHSSFEYDDPKESRRANEYEPNDHGTTTLNRLSHSSLGNPIYREVYPVPSSYPSHDNSVSPRQSPSRQSPSRRSPIRILQDIGNSRYAQPNSYSQSTSRPQRHMNSGKSTDTSAGRVHKQLRKPSASEVQKEALLYRTQRLEKDLDAKTSQNRNLEKTIVQLKKDLQGYDSSLVEKVHKLKYKLNEMMDANTDLMRRDEELEISNSQLADEIAELKSQNTELSKTISAYTQTHDTSTVKIRELESDLALKSREVASIHDNFTELKRKFEDASQHISSLAEEKSALHQSNLSLIAEVESLKMSYQSALDEISEAVNSKDSLSGVVSQLEAELAEDRQRIAEYESRLESMAADKQGLSEEAELQKADLNHQLAAEKQRNHEEMTRVLADFDSKLKSMEDQLHMECESHGVTANMLNDAKEKLNATDDRLLRLQQQHEELLTSTHDNMETYTANMTNITAKLKATTNELDNKMARLASLEQEVSQLNSQKQKLALETFELAKCLDMEITKRKARESSLAHAEGELRQMASELSEKNMTLKVNNDYYEECRKESQTSIIELQSKLEQALADLETQKETNSCLLERKQENEKISHLQDQLDKQNELLFQERQTTRRLQNQIQEMKGTIRLVARVRPQIKDAGATTSPLMNMSLSPSEIVLNETAYGAEGNERQRQLKVQFDRVFGPEASNDAVCEETEYLIQGALDGRNASILAYGQTGSGKTWTMSGKGGIIAYALRKIMLAAKQDVAAKYQISVEAVEIYNENIRDMLSPETQTHQTGLITRQIQTGNKISIRTGTGSRQSELVGAKRIVVTSEAQAFALLKKAVMNRSVGSTAANSRSSRSHFLFSIHITSVTSTAHTGIWSSENGKASSEPLHGVLHLVDLAGSERVTQSQVTGVQLNETKAINQSLSALGNVINALQNNAPGKHIPYRSSKLTHLLQSALSENAKTMLLTAVAPEQTSIEETKSTLRFAEKASKAVLKSA